MQVHVSTDAAASVATGALVVPVFADGAVDGVAAEVDRALGGAIADSSRAGEITGKPNETSLVHAKDAPYKRVLVVGLGERDNSAVALAKYAGTAVRYLGKRNVDDDRVRATRRASMPRSAASFVAEGAIAATIDTTTYRTEPDKPVVDDRRARSWPARYDRSRRRGRRRSAARSSAKR